MRSVKNSWPKQTGFAVTALRLLIYFIDKTTAEIQFVNEICWS